MMKRLPMNMNSMLRKRPELVLTLGVWALTLAAAWMRHPLVGDPYGSETLWYIVATLGAVMIPALLFGGRTRDVQRPPVPSWLLTVATMAALLVSVWITFYVRRELAHLDVGDQRAIKGVATVEAGPLGRANYLFNALGLVAPFLLALRVRRILSAVAVFGALVGLAVFFFAKVGLRTELMPVLLVYCTSIVLWRQDLIRLTWTRLALCGVALFIGGLGMNTVMSIAASRGGLYGPTANFNMDRGARVLQSVGMQNAPDAVLMCAGQASEYILGPVYYFDFYKQAPVATLALGGHQFDLVARRFGNTSGPQLKMDVDELYLDIGIEWNVWATALREMMVDFGETGSLVAFAILGVFCGVMRRRSPTMMSARYLLSLFFAYLIVSPFFSTMKSGFFEAGLYLGLVAFVCEALALKPKVVLSKRATSRPNPSRACGLSPASS